MASTRVLRKMLYGTSATDLPTFMAVVAMLAAVALIAILVPASRATRIDPLTALRAE
jgi:ABC-type lipoprotein release transport system permease subunit